MGMKDEQLLTIQAMGQASGHLRSGSANGGAPGLHSPRYGERRGLFLLSYPNATICASSGISSSFTAHSSPLILHPLPASGLLNVDKPAGITSRDAVDL